MTEDRDGPDIKVEGRIPNQDRPPTHNTSTHHGANNGTQSTPQAVKTPGKSLVWLPCTWDHPQDLRSQLERRREAARRLPPICDRCGARDPICCRCWDPEPPLSERALDGYRAAAEHLLETGLTCVLPIEVLQRFWRNSGADRELALRVWGLTGGLVA